MNQSIVDIFSKLESATGSNAKIELLKEFKDSEILKRVLDYGLNPYKVFNIKQIPKLSNFQGTISLSDFLDKLYLFEDRILTGNEAKNKLAELLSSLSVEEADIAIRIIRRNLKLGVDNSTVNKAIPNLIPVYPCLLATKYSRQALTKIVWPAFSQLKSDGMRANIFVESGNVYVRGRSGKTVDLMGNFSFLANYGMTNYVLDGELVIVDDNNTIMPRPYGNGIFNKAIRSGTININEAHRAVLIAWDIIPLDDFNNIDKKAPAHFADYNVRWNNLVNYVNSIDNNKIRLIENRIVNNIDEVMRHYQEVISLGEEGIIVKNMHHKWENRRSEHLVKIKPEEECDMEVIGWNPGNPGTENEHGLGSLIIASSDRKVISSMSGFSRDLRKEIFANIDEWMGKIVTVKYTNRIQDTDRPDIDSLFSPRFIELREDKLIADSSEDIK